LPRDQVSIHFARKPPSGGFFFAVQRRTAIFSDFAMPERPLRLFEQK
jgi:hypothetical protein